MESVRIGCVVVECLRLCHHVCIRLFGKRQEILNPELLAGRMQGFQVLELHSQP